MKNLYTIIKKPLFTEKGSSLKELQNKILVEVSRDANKVDIKKSVEEIFKVKVEKVSTINLKGKWKKYGRSIGKRPDRKKAVITLKKGEKLDFIEGA
ncbi:MAG: 50S ribosomal protein L23 [Nitrospirae bacterium CG_4_10_14_0_8_um_filter_41_23]|nr:50S ribosomal protein L23 [Nitrospirota bacterium]OIP60596.1 MAG: 50S ribosomal protein L23 [Nitrospirae bacterium CG2_30_41_42]PIQ94992.1 MAG: 50S ribosomal protein L23 [Nitrospirae bacterium CG11_big_fil_rev_8_21_14_0_20_41_14]PIV41472.1 MAG: 50S ribosomal protein L23 [Nitrospirae bacterium CG02_land_8_20_14_3_00_41_53]PIW87142.1 MAG: 50S ribosomal protein L23 [Nitrospirae bacterium CG_4_8_14_3_um_filter_41_47]PIY87088.1 MAG: 50S ribosomal protein L23 [Nitrospirae bacterium CG_4_10_14_0_8